MHTFLNAVQRLDISVFHYLNGFAGNWLLDRAVSEIESTTLLKGALYLALYWYLWFRSGPDREKRRESIILIVFGVALALFVARSIAFTLPFRLRPIYDPTVSHHPYSYPVIASLENWSSFPSDTVCYFFAMACGIASLARRLAIPIMLYTFVWIGLPRLYYGVHYVSDMTAGAVIGITVVWLVLKSDWLRSRVAVPALASMEAAPQWFYAGASLVSLEMATMFADLRAVAREALHAARIGPYHEIARSLLIAAVMIGLAAAAACLWYLRSRRQIPVAPEPLTRAGAVTPSRSNS